MRFSLTCGPYESAVSMKLVPSSTARRKTAFASSRSAGSPQIPGPVRRIEPKPRRFTVRSSPIPIVPACAAEMLIDSIVDSVLRGELLQLGGVREHDGGFGRVRSERDALFEKERD